MIRLASALSSFLSAGLLLPAALLAQTPPEFEGELDVTEVLLDVLVTDRDGRVILGLGAGDFSVEEDGEPVEIADIAFYSNRRALDEPESGDQALVDRYFILVFDDPYDVATTVPAVRRQYLQAVQQTRRWVAEAMRPNDWVAVAAYSRSLRLLGDFTRDPAAVDHALERVLTGRDDGGNWPSRRSENGTPSLGEHLPSGKELSRATPRIYDALRLLGEAADQIPARKNLLLFSTGFGELDSFRQYRPDPVYYRPMQESLNTHNVAVYTLDLMPVEVSHSLGAALNQLASGTGGRAYFNFTSFVTPLRQIDEENNGYYLLSYRSRHETGEAGFQKVEVKVRNPELRVRARHGYVYGATDG